MNRWGFLAAVLLASCSSAIGYVAGRGQQASEDQQLVRLCNGVLHEIIEKRTPQVQAVEDRMAALEQRTIEFYEEARGLRYGRRR